MTHLRGEEPEPYRLTTTGLLEVDDSFYEAYMLVFPSRLPLVKRCIRALELEAPPVSRALRAAASTSKSTGAACTLRGTRY